MPVLYPLDPNGNLPSNLIPMEVQSVSASSFGQFNFFVPAKAPFYSTLVNGDPLYIRHVSSNKILREGVDFVYGHKHSYLSLVTAKSVYGSIVLTDPTMTGEFEFGPYQIIGDNFTVNDAALALLYGDTTRSPRFLTWEQIVGTPYEVPPFIHDFDWTALKGTDELITAIKAMADTIAARNQIIPDLQANILSQIMGSDPQPEYSDLTLIAKRLNQLPDHHYGTYLNETVKLRAIEPWKPHLVTLGGGTHYCSAVGQSNGKTTAYVFNGVNTLEVVEFDAYNSMTQYTASISLDSIPKVATVMNDILYVVTLSCMVWTAPIASPGSFTLLKAVDIKNGQFTSGFDNWIIEGDITPTIVNSQAILTTSTIDDGRINQTIPTIPGRTYTVNLGLTVTGSYAGFFLNGVLYRDGFTGNQAITFTATGVTTEISIAHRGGSGGQAIISSVSVNLTPITGTVEDMSGNMDLDPLVKTTDNRVFEITATGLSPITLNSVTEFEFLARVTPTSYLGVTHVGKTILYGNSITATESVAVDMTGVTRFVLVDPIALRLGLRKGATIECYDTDATLLKTLELGTYQSTTDFDAWFIGNTVVMTGSRVGTDSVNHPTGVLTRPYRLTGVQLTEPYGYPFENYSERSRSGRYDPVSCSSVTAKAFIELGTTANYLLISL